MTRSRAQARRRCRIIVAAVVAAVVAGQASAQPMRRPAAQRQRVVRLAYVLGEAHALRRLCTGPTDPTWYDRMQRLLAQETMDEASRRQLVESFNAGFAARHAEFSACTPRSQAAERDVADQGRTLASALANDGP